jgi:hypothetical protein
MRNSTRHGGVNLNYNYNPAQVCSTHYCYMLTQQKFDFPFQHCHYPYQVSQRLNQALFLHIGYTTFQLFHHEGHEEREGIMSYFYLGQSEFPKRLST